MKRLDKITNKELECLFTEAAYDSFKHNPNYEDEVLVRMKQHYRTTDGEDLGCVYLFRLASERGSNLRYRPESWYQMKDDMRRRHRR